MTRSNSTETLSTRSYLSFSNESIHETQKDKFSDLDTESGEETYFDALDDTEV